MKLSNLELLEGIKSQDKRILGKAITLVESKKPEHRAQAEELLKMVLPLSGKSIRIGITGVPGAGSGGHRSRGLVSGPQHGHELRPATTT